MKVFIKKFSFFLLAFSMLFAACETEESLEISTPDPVFELQTPSINNIFLNFDLPNNPAFTISWNNGLSTSASYTVEMSTDDAFTTPVVLGTTDETSFTMTVMDFNDALKSVDIKSYEDVAVYMRVNDGTNTSNSILYFVTTYAVEAPEVTSPTSTFSAVLSDVDPDAVAMTVEFSDPEVGANSTATINYEVQMALAGTNFATAYSLGSTTDASLDVSHGVINEFALTAGATADAASNFDIRVVSTVTNATGDLVRTSDPVTISITPYSVELPPVLYVVGAGAADAGWDWATPVELVLQGKKYSGNINLVNDAFRFFTVKDDWGSGQNFPYYEARGYTFDSNLVNALDGDSNFSFTGTPGQYYIEIDTENETITLGPPVIGPNCSFDQLWGVGAALVNTGWDWASPAKFRCTGTGTYEGNVELTNDAFRFFTTKDDWGSGRNYPYYANDGYTIDANFEDALDGDNNFRFTGTPGVYFLSIDTVNKTITLEAEKIDCEFPQLYLVGAGVPDAGWDWTTPVQFDCVGKGLYQAQVNFANDAFRFFTANGDWGSGRNFPYYINEGYTIDASFEDALDGDNNFRFVGTPGTYTLTMDTIAKTITVE